MCTFLSKADLFRFSSIWLPGEMATLFLKVCASGNNN